MAATTQIDPDKKHSLHALEATNFFLADVQTGLGPFLAAYLAASGWNPGNVGAILTLGGITTVLLQTPAGSVIDHVRRKRLVLAAGTVVLALGALILAWKTDTMWVATAQVLIGGTAPFLGPTLAAITLGIVGVKGFDRQFGRNQGFNSAGNVLTALLVIGISHFISYRAIFIFAALLVVPTIVSVLRIDRKQIDYDQARGGLKKETKGSFAAGIRAVLTDRVLLLFLFCAFLFHSANAAMLPQLGEMLAKGDEKNAAAFMSASIIVTQTVIMCSAAWIGKQANLHGRKPLLLVGFGVLPIRAVLYTLTHATAALISIQFLDGVANAIFGVVSILLVADRTSGTGQFNFAQGVLATAVGIGAALSTTFGGKLIQHFSYRISFLGLGSIALLAFLLLLFAIPETKTNRSQDGTHLTATPEGTHA
jgi:MFS family permease